MVPVVVRLPLLTEKSETLPEAKFETIACEPVGFRATKEGVVPVAICVVVGVAPHEDVEKYST